MATNGLFVLDHIPVVVNTAIVTAYRKTKITVMKHNPSLDNSDKGAVRRFIARNQKLADNLGNGLRGLSLSEITKASVDIVRDIHNRHTAKNPEIWSPIARLLSLRLSALGSTIRLGIRGDNTALREIVTRLRREERNILLNGNELKWLDDNDISDEPMEWNEWRNSYPYGGSVRRTPSSPAPPYQ